MKVVAFNGSPRKNGNTSLLIQEVFREFEKEGIETEVIQIGNKSVHGCTGCMKCKEVKDGRCHIKNDLLNLCIEKMVEADGIIIGSPVYFADVTTEVKALIDVAGYATRSGGHLLKRKIGAAVIAVRRGGALHAFETINNFFLINQMIVPGSSYWNFAIGRDPGDVLNDEEGIKTMKELGQNMSWLLRKIHQ
jgi:multimeric flavodoxin WrbA